MSRSIIAAVDDIFFASKIRAVAEHLGLKIHFARGLESVIANARELKPDLIIVDLHSSKIEPIALAKALKSDNELRSTQLLGFFSHVQTALKQQAEEAGYNHVLPRSAFTKDLAAILEGSARFGDS